MYAVLFPDKIALSRDRDQRVAVIDGYKWASKNARLQELLNANLDPGGPGGEIPDPDWDAAQAMIDKYGGKVIKKAPKPAPERGTVL